MTTRFHKLTLALGAMSLAILISSMPVSAQTLTSGGESISGALVVSGLSGTRRVVSSAVIARGAFSGTGRIVERDNLPGDPDEVSRDDLVFADGTLHVVNTNVDVNFQLDPRTCVYTVNAKQTTRVEGGTGRFAHASGTFAATVIAHGIGSRHADGLCAQDQAPLSEVDSIDARGNLSI
jgi:hypothetical protein